MLPTTRRASLTASLLLVSTIAQAGQPPRLKDSEFAALAERWTDLMKDTRVPGVAVVIVRGDEIIALDGLGVRDVDSGKPVTPDTMFYIASCTKPFNALACVALSELKKVDLDGPVRAVLPQMQLADPALTEKLTLRDLLCHRPGIDNGEIVFADAYSGLITDEMYFRLLPKARIRNQVSYSNVHYTLAGRVMQHVGGKDWRDVLDETVLKPSGMTRTTGYASRMYADPDVALPHIFDAGNCTVSPLRKTDRTMHAAGGLGSSAGDLGRWLRLHLNGGTIDGKRVVSAEGMAQMLTEQSRMPEPRGKIRREDSFGLGWMKGTFRGQGPYYSHGGGYIGASAYIAFMPEKKLGFAVLVNCGEVGSGVNNVIAVDVFDKLLGTSGDDLAEGVKREAAQFHARPSQLPTGKNPAAEGGLSGPASACAGVYVHETDGELLVTFTHGKLGYKYGDLVFDLYSTGLNEFTAVVVPGMRQTGKFEITGGKVIAVQLEFDGNGGSKRFVRRQ
jgi:CubicO group peptidase (beta-lactamase class C family)